MDEKKPASPWDELVEELGVEADPQALERHQPKPTELPSIVQKLGPEKPLQPPKPKPGDWNELAGSLGLEVPPIDEDEPSTEVDDELPELRSDFDKALVESTGDSDLEDGSHPEAGMSGEAARTAFDALFADAASDWALPTSAGNVLDTPLEFTSDDVAAAEDFDSELAEEEPAEEPPKRRRPRRRRRGRGGRGAKEGADRETERPADELEVESFAEEDQEEDEGLATETAKEERPRRRRPRRRRRRGAGDERAPAGAERVADEDANEDDDEDDNAASQGGLFDLGDEDDDEGGEESSSRQRANHRNLPTWSEAIGVIVDSNMQNRSKSPAKPSSPRGRGRGGRGRKRN